jgi:hypothetical protein
MRPSSPVFWMCRRIPSCLSSSLRSWSPKITSSSVRAEWRITTSFISSQRERWRSMLMIGVMPLPALMNSSFSGSGSGSVKSPSTPPRRMTVPGLALRTRCGVTVPSSTSLGVTLIQPSGCPGSEVIEYARQWCTPSTITPMRRYCPGSWPGHS